ncbi:MAG: type II secretion system protein [Desulfobacterales bacterium]
MVKKGASGKRVTSTSARGKAFNLIAGSSGFTLMGVLVLVTISGIGLMGASQSWRTIAQREREEALLFQGDQIRRAIASYYTAGAAGAEGEYPQRMEDLLRDPRFPTVQRHLRKLYKNPLDPEGKWEFVLDGTGRIKGVFASRKEKPLKVKRFAEDYSEFENAKTYTDWKFIFVPNGAASNSGTPEGAGGEG